MPPTCARRATVAELKFDALYGPSLPWLTAYSSFVPTTISGLPSPFRSPIAGVSMIAPWSSSSPAFALKVGASVCGSTALIFERSTTSTGNPSTLDPSACHAYTWRSMFAATISRSPPLPSRSATTGDPMNPCCVR
jgi:hypothetical protein